MTKGITLSHAQENEIDKQVTDFTTSTAPTFINSSKLVWLFISHEIKVNDLQLKVIHIEQSNLEQAITDLEGRKPYAAVFYNPKTNQYFQRDTFPIPTICVGIDFWEKDQKLKPGSRLFFKFLRKAGITIQLEQSSQFGNIYSTPLPPSPDSGSFCFSLNIKVNKKARIITSPPYLSNI